MNPLIPWGALLFAGIQVHRNVSRSGRSRRGIQTPGNVLV